LAGVGVLLLIACANLANLLLARGAARRTEIALRLSLGASRGRLIRQLLTESLALAAVGGVAGLALAYVLHGALVRMMAQSSSDFQMSFALDPMVLAFTLGATLGAALLFGLMPAFQATRISAGESLKEQGRGASGSLGRMRWGRFLVGLQLALSLPLLVGAGLLVRTLYNLQTVDLGYSAEHLLLVRVDAREADAVRSGGVFRELLGQLQQIPGVRAASFSSSGVFSGGYSESEIKVEGYTATGNHDRGSHFEVVGPKYFSTLGVPVVLGRELVESDAAATTKYCVINEAFAKQFFEGRNPIGMRVTSLMEGSDISHQIVGVVKNARTQNLRDDVRPRYFVPSGQPPFDNLRPIFLIRSAANPGTVLSAARQTIQRVDPSMPILDAQLVQERMAPLLAQERAIAQLAMAFGGVAILLAAIGLYGVLSYGVVRRRSEIAIRIALGAQAGRVIGMILRETAVLIVAGLTLGAGVAYAAARLITTQLFGVTPEDPLTFGLAVALLVLVALFAAYLPAHRASRVDPMAALRSE
jgi:predicted permease